MKLSPDNIIVLGELAEQKNDATLEELREKLHQQTQVEVSSSLLKHLFPNGSYPNSGLELGCL